MADSTFDNGFKRIVIKRLDADDGDAGSVRFIITDLITGSEIIAAFTVGETYEIAGNLVDAIEEIESDVDESWNVDYHSRRPEDCKD